MGEYILLGAKYLLDAYYFAMIFYIISSWIPSLRENGIGRFVGNIVEPYLKLFRFIPPIGMIDISPIVGFFVYGYIVTFALNGLALVLGFFNLL